MLKTNDSWPDDATAPPRQDDKLVSSNTPYLRIGVLAPELHQWPSVERARQFFNHALASYFMVEPLCAFSQCITTDGLRAIINFATPTGWNLETSETCSRLFVMLGGPVIDRSFLASNLGRLRTSDCLMVTCSSDVQILKDMCQASAPLIKQIYLPVNLSLFHPGNTAVCKFATGVDKFDFVIGFVARLLPQKNLHIFLRELAELRALFKDKRIGGIVVGNYWVDYPGLPYETDIYPSRIQHLIAELGLEEAVIYHPATLSDEDLANCYRSMDVLFHPTTSIDENYGYAPLEAMACGIPVVGSSYGGLKDTIKHGETGFLMHTWFTANGIRMDRLSGHDSLVQLCRQPLLKQTMGRAAVKHIRRNYSVDRCALALKDCVERAVELQRDSHPVNAKPAWIDHYVDSSLPAVEPPLDYFGPSIKHYVSGRHYSMTGFTWTRLSAPLISCGDSVFRVADPAWPSLLRLNRRTQVLLEHFTEWSQPLTLYKYGYEEKDIMPWIRSGILITSIATPPK